MIEAILLGLAGTSVLLNLWQWYVARRFPIHRKLERSGPLPALSILKPLKGVDSQTEGCLRSWFEQEYPEPTELLFGVADEHDPSCALVRKLAREFPDQLCKLVVCHPVLGPNAKVSSICYLVSVAAHEHLIIGDDDVEVSRDFLEQLILPLLRGASLVNCFYVMKPLNAAMAVEAVAVNADFWTQVLQANMIRPMHFALGAALATRKSELQKIGGFESLLHDLADDYHLGNRIARASGKLSLCTTPAICWTGEQSAIKVWNHQLRWARTIRFCQPLPYFLSILGNGTLWLALAAALAPNSPRTIFVAQIGFLIRLFSARDNYRRLTGENGWIAFGLAPVKDLLSALIWALAFLGNTVVWRGQRFRVGRGGKLTPQA